jgi:hypothetical protein
MIDEQAIEQAVMDRITDARPVFETQHPGQQWFKVIQNTGLADIDLENVREFVKAEPACLVEYGSETAQQMDQAAESYMIVAKIYVFVFVKGMLRPGDTSRNADRLARVVQNALAGANIRQGNQFGKLYYRGATARAASCSGRRASTGSTTTRSNAPTSSAATRAR